jgi:hypothetical protein
LTENADVIGYSEGGLIALTCAGKYNLTFNSFIGISNPFNGAFRFDDTFNANTIVHPILWLIANTILLGTDTMEFLDKRLVQNKYGKYMTKGIDNMLNNKKQLYEIFGTLDIVATKSSSNFYNEKFKFKELHEDHLSILNNYETFASIWDFYGEVGKGFGIKK